MNSYKKRLAMLFLPIMISNLISQVQMLIDRIFLGKLGILYMTAVGNATSTIWTTMSVIYSLGTGASILISQSIGEGKKDRAHEFSGALFLYHNILPIILFLVWMFASPLIFTFMGLEGNVLEYSVTYTRYFSPIFLLCGLGSALVVCLQTSNNTKPLVMYGIIRSGVNIILDYVLIFGKLGFPEMGIAGAALATTIAEFAGAVYIGVVFLLSKELSTKPSKKEIFSAKIGPYLKSVKLGINTALEDFSWNFGNLMIIKILNSINDTAAGIYSIVFSMELISTVVVGALGNATVTLTGEATGAKDIKLFKNITKTAATWAIFVSATALVVYILFPNQLLGLFTNDPAIIAGSAIYLILVGVNMFSKSGNIIVGSAIRGSGDTRWMFFTQIIGTVGVITIAYLLVNVFNLGIIGVFIAVLADETFRAIVNLIRFLKINFEYSSMKKRLA